jgi:hypothetical protein
MDNEDTNAKMLLPVIGLCDHVCSYGCVLKQQMARAGVDGGRGCQNESIAWNAGKLLHSTQIHLGMIVV